MPFALFRWILALHSGYWFLPSMLTLAGFVLALWCLHIDGNLGDRAFEESFGVFLADPSGSRAILSTIAATVITVCGTVFSITIVVLTMASAQFGPRIVPNFMRKNGTQVVMGLFIGTFVYAVVVLGTFGADGDAAFVPQVSVATGLFLGIGCFLGLIYFIHHVAMFIQVPEILDGIQRDLHRVFDSHFPRGDASTTRGDPDDEDFTAPPELEREARAVLAPSSGYIQAIDHVDLIRHATASDALIVLDLRVGRFVMKGDVLARVHPGASADDDMARAVGRCFAVGARRTIPHDVEFGIDQMVEVAVRALSPGINDPFTAINCIDRLGASLADFGERKLRSRFQRDATGTIRVIEPVPTYAGAVDAAFNQIRQNGRSHPAVGIRMLEVVHRLGRRALPAAMVAALARHADMVRDDWIAAGLNPHDEADLRARHAAALASLREEHRATFSIPP